MRIDGSNLNTIQSQPPAKSLVEGDIVRGKVLSSENGQVRLQLTDGSALQARISGDVDLQPGTTVRLQIGEKVEGIPTAKVLETLTNGKNAAPVTLQESAATALKDFGGRVLPQAVDKVLALVTEKGLDVQQAAFLTANGIENNTASATLLQRILDGQFGLSQNWQTLSTQIARILGQLPLTDQNALVLPLQVSEQLDALLSGFKGLDANTQDGLKTLLLQWSENTPETADAVKQLQSLLLTATTGTDGGGKALLEMLSGQSLLQTLAGAGSPGGTAVTGVMPANAGVSAGTTLQAAGLQPDVVSETMNLSAVDSQALANSQMKPEAMTQNNLLSEKNIDILHTDGTMVQNRPIAEMLDGIVRAVNATEQGLATTTTVGTLQGAQGILSGSALAQLWMNTDKLVQIAAAFADEGGKALSAEQVQDVVNKAFHRVFVQTGADVANGKADLDIAKMTQLVKEQLAWSSRVLSASDAATANALRPVLEDTAGAMRLFQQISTYQTFVQIPLQMNQQLTQGELYVMKRKGRRGNIDVADFTLFLSLDTANLGHLESLAHAKNKQVTLHFQVENVEIQTLLRETKASLFDGLQKKGYRLIDMKVRTGAEQPISLLTAIKEAESRLGRNEGVDVRV